ncbi:hypothetical protein [Salinibaculum rarum]|uniref:hypothetical protein n=1 Tax=Salinibaculum rarum TaxID=3058903 RepID=UPI00265DFABF|nr:hypothetical protein [Salinibaculum sp. KK48]
MPGALSRAPRSTERKALGRARKAARDDGGTSKPNSGFDPEQAAFRAHRGRHRRRDDNDERQRGGYPMNSERQGCS